MAYLHITFLIDSAKHFDPFLLNFLFYLQKSIFCIVSKDAVISKPLIYSFKHVATSVNVMVSLANHLGSYLRCLQNRPSAPWIVATESSFRYR